MTLLRRLLEEGGWGRVWTGLGMAIALAGGGLIYQQVTQDEAPAGSAHLWIDTNGGTCTRQSPAGSYDDGSACATIDAAVTAASCGDTVIVKGGTYSTGQSVSTTNLNGCDGNKVVISEAEGESADFTAYIDVDAPAANFEFHDVAVSGYAGSCAGGCSISLGYHDVTATRVRDIRLENIDMRSFVTGYVDNIDIVGGDVGPATSDVIRSASVFEAGPYAGTDILIDGVYFHDFTQVGENHSECLLIWSGERVTVRGNTFWNCDSTGAMYVTELNSTSSPQGWCLDILIENNLFYVGTPGGGSGPVLQDDCEITFRNNTLGPGAGLSLEDWEVDAANGDGCGEGAGPHCDMEILGNYGYRNECGPGANFLFRDNVWVGASCHATDLNAGSFEVVDTDDDFHLAGGSDAIDNGYATSYPSTDIDGDARYLGSGPDAGADEKE